MPGMPGAKCCCDDIPTDCCPNAIPTVLTCQIIFPSGPCVGTVEVTLTWNPIDEQWQTAEIICGDFGDPIQLFLECPDTSLWYAASPAQPGSQEITGTLECDPFYIEMDDGSGSFLFPGGTASKIIIFE